MEDKFKILHGYLLKDIQGYTEQFKLATNESIAMQAQAALDATRRVISWMNHIEEELKNG